MTTSFSTMAAIRFGYGRRPGETPPESVEALIRQVERGTRETCLFPFEGIAGRRARFFAFREVQQAYNAARDANMLVMVGEQSVNPYNIVMANAFRRDQHLKVRQAVFSPNGFFERLAAFWGDHFAIDARKGGAMRILAGLHEAEAIRPNLGGSFSDLLKAAVLHPAMLAYLDQTRSIGPNSPVGLKSGRGLNENLARELIELHTMGAGSGYSQKDVRSTAFVLTGLWFRNPVYETVYRTRSAEPGSYRVLGKSYGGRARQIEQVYALLDDLADRKETRRHICRKLVVHFIADDPPQPVVDAMVKAWGRSGGQLVDVYRAMLEHPLSFEEEGRKARQPFDFVVAALRALNVPAEALGPGEDAKKAGVRPATDVTALQDVATMTAAGKPALGANPLSVGIIDRLGQPIWSAPNPAGWEENLSAWVTGSQLTERIAWARRLVARFGGTDDPRMLLEATMADAARADTVETVSRAPNRAVGLAMVLASPEFNRR
ncbi:DUF1800 domain-containing protein [Shinella sp.]|uniref:DUF1800 domain-containing protein n=1 Tax=Shinella sp. TaxID=1870904 RepID=UPI003F6EDB15